MLWVFGALIGVIILAGLSLMLAISRNGPAVLSTVDRLTGGKRGAEHKATIATGSHGAQKLMVWGPERLDPADAPLPVLVFAHGGSWRNGNPIDYGFIARAFVPEGFIVVLAGYRLGEDGIYPAMLEDTASAVKWAYEEIEAYGGDPDRIVLAGHSAGAYNIVMTALEDRWLARHGLSPAVISGVVGLSGPYDFAPFKSESTIASFGHVAEPHTTQPITHVHEDAPPALLIHGEKDSLVGPRNTRELAQRLEQVGASAEVIFTSEMEHNDPLISLASPWRDRRDIAQSITRFAKAISNGDTDALETSVSVQEERR